MSARPPSENGAPIVSPPPEGEVPGGSAEGGGGAPSPSLTVDRIRSAAQDRNVVVDAAGLLAVFNDAGVLGRLDVTAATTIARLCGETDEQVMLAAALAVRGTRFGHVCVRLATQRDTVTVDGLGGDGMDDLPWPDPSPWQERVAASVLVGDGSGDEPLVLDGDRLYLERYHRYEQRFASLIEERCRRSARPVSDRSLAMLARLLPSGGDGTPTRQHQAAVLGLRGSVAVIAGGPGTGKTHTVGAMLAALAAAGSEDFPLTAVCAPTGKAAARLGEALVGLAAGIDEAPAPVAEGEVAATLRGVAPSTIHRLLGWTWDRGRFAHDATNRLPHELVIVDEMSMVSLPMAAKLLDAVRDEATVVLVGDPFQLESIEAGTVLADIVGPALAPEPDVPEPGVSASIGAHVVVLDRVHRFAEGGVIADFAEAVRTGDADRAVDLLTAGHDELRWVPDRESDGFGGLWSSLVDQRLRMVEQSGRPGDAPGALRTLSELAVLCARRRGPDGVARWGSDIEAALDERFTGLRWDREWYPGRPVMITRNDYPLDLYNGDIGVCIETDHGMRAVFDRGGVREVPLSHLGEHTTVHAMTIHKSQGSQFDAAVVVLPAESSPLLTRELLYTAVTRATTRIHLVADESVVRSAITRSVERASGLGARLWGS